MGTSMSNSDYHVHPAIGSSGIKQLLENPHDFIAKTKREPTKAMMLGSAVHKLVLEPDDFESEFCIYPEFNSRTNEGKAAKAAFESEIAGKTFLSSDDFDTARRCRDAVMNSPAAKFLNGAVFEQSYFAEIDGIQTKCRPDAFNKKLKTIIDLKVVEDASPDGFIKSVGQYGYYIQDPFYTAVMEANGHDIENFMFIAVEKKGNFMVGHYDLDPVAKDFGRSEIMRAFDIYRRLDEFKKPFYKCTKTGNIVQTLSLPNWVFYKNGASY